MNKPDKQTAQPWFAGYACVHIPEFPAQTLVRLRPQLSGKAVSVMAGHAPLEKVCAANAKARRDGVVNGMTRLQAESFSEHTLLRRSLQGEEAARMALLGSLIAFAPAMETCHSGEAAVCVLDVTGMSRLHATPRSFGESLRGTLRKHGFYASVAISANFHAAAMLAQALPGVTVTLPGEEAQTLAPLLLQGFQTGVFALNGEQLETLELWGVRTLGGLAALPLKQLIARMGQSGKRLRALARGEHPHLFAPVAVPFELLETFEFDAPVRLLEGILFAVAAMLDRMVLQARERSLAIASVTLRCSLSGRALDTEDDGRTPPSQGEVFPHVPIANRDGGIHLVPPLIPGAPGTIPVLQAAQTTYVSAAKPHMFERKVRPTLPTLDKRLLLKLLQLDLAAHPPDAPVLAITLQAVAAATGAVQTGLFAPPLPEPSRLDVTLARLSALVGEDRVGSPSLRNTHMPDSFAMEPFRVAQPLAQKDEAKAKSAPAIRQMRPPEPIQVQTEQGQPARFWYGGMLYKVETVCGPWKLNGAWWGGEAWSHECWDIEAEHYAGPPPAAAPPTSPFLVQAQKDAGLPRQRLCCRVHQDAASGAWYLDGIYD